MTRQAGQKERRTSENTSKHEDRVMLNIGYLADVQHNSIFMLIFMLILSMLNIGKEIACRTSVTMIKGRGSPSRRLGFRLSCTEPANHMLHIA
ncbi:hypothetical protein Y032_0018g3519 [Ancylostoma ceylanicum]|uniref:Uncharacterized protein n=1 Tax=Ancylostoma ceylanicum TaxID=53326 RepID=A0A016V2S5_9BILA|nr:hypothetical protein Y032_0018g3519 [Ancylostoma ceylanicum]